MAVVLSSTLVNAPTTVATSLYAMDQWWQPGNSDERWDLTSGLSGVALQSGVRGLLTPPFIQYSQKSPAIAGSRWRGYQTDEREVFWPLAVFQGNGGADFIAHDRHLWRGLRPDVPGTWAVTQPGGESRQLRIRFAGLDNADLDLAPELTGYVVYGLNFVAEQPFWTGTTISRVFGPTPGTTPNFLGGGTASAGPPFVLASGSTQASATIANPGDVPAWPIWTLYGPMTSATIGTGGYSIAVPFSLNSSEWLRLDTDPSQRVALVGSGPVTANAGDDRTADLGVADFGQVDPASEADLDINVVGTGQVGVEITPNYFRAW